MQIAVDVMGGDHGCGVIIAGAKLALQTNKKISQLFLVGNEAEISTALEKQGVKDERVTIINASQVLTMEDKPVVGLRKKKDCSILRAVELIREGAADALISPGNTGGVVAASTIRLRPLPGVDRPGIATVIPAPHNEFVLLDAGANVECKPIHLLHYAIMGSVYSQEILGYKSPRVGLLNVGTEEVKGNELTLEAFRLCKQVELNFIGNIEGHDLFNAS
jgi:phosphate acyltransferase